MLLERERDVFHDRSGCTVSVVTLGDSGPDSTSVLAVAGVGFGLMSGAFSMINLLADALGPGTVGIHGDSQLYFLTSGEQPEPCAHISTAPQRWQTQGHWLDSPLHAVTSMMHPLPT